MAHKLADETLADILSDSLAIRDADFANTTAEKSPFAHTEESSSSLLLVCKRWMRVATPLLYDTVVLRSTPQAQALAAALQSNKALGRYIKKLRIEGGYGAAVSKILKAAPNITDFCMTLHLFATDNIGPMCKALMDSTFAPRRLILCEPNYKLNANKQVNLAIVTLSQCITTWQSLRVVVLADTIVYESEFIRNALYHAPRLEEIQFPQDSARNLGDEVYSSTMSCLAERSSAPIIRCGWPEIDLSSFFESDMKKGLSPTALKKLRFTSADLTAVESAANDVISQSSNPLYVPMVHAPVDVRERIWSMILQQVIDHTNGVDAATRDLWNMMNVDSPLRLPRGPVLQCMRVCKLWKSIATPLACRRVRIDGSVAFFSLVDLGSRHPEVMRLIRELRLFHRYSRISLSDEVASAVPALLSRVQELKSFAIERAILPPGVLPNLHVTSGASLVELSIGATAPSVYLVPPFPALRTLRIECCAGSSFDTTDPAAEYPTLEKIHAEGVGSGGLLQMLAQCRLPRVTFLKFEAKCGLPTLEAFAQVHGRKILKLTGGAIEKWLRDVLPMFPSISILELEDWTAPPSAHLITPEAPHVALEELICPDDGLSRDKLDESHRKLWSRFFDGLQTDSFPALQQVRINHYGNDFWPTTPREIAKSPLPALAEQLLQRGLRMVDRQGIAWKPRLTSQKRR